MNDGKLIETINLAELEAELKRLDALPLTDPEHPRGFEWDAECEGWIIWWGGYDYFVEHSRIKTPERLLGWIDHLGTKNWKHSSTPRLARWARAVSARNGWKIH